MNFFCFLCAISDQTWIRFEVTIQAISPPTIKTCGMSREITISGQLLCVHKKQYHNNMVLFFYEHKTLATLFGSVIVNM